MGTQGAIACALGQTMGVDPFALGTLGIVVIKRLISPLGMPGTYLHVFLGLEVAENNFVPVEMENSLSITFFTYRHPSPKN